MQIPETPLEELPPISGGAWATRRISNHFTAPREIQTRHLNVEISQKTNDHLIRLKMVVFLFFFLANFDMFPMSSGSQKVKSWPSMTGQ